MSYRTTFTINCKSTNVGLDYIVKNKNIKKNPMEIGESMGKFPFSFAAWRHRRVAMFVSAAHHFSDPSIVIAASDDGVVNFKVPIGAWCCRALSRWKPYSLVVLVAGTYRVGFVPVWNSRGETIRVKIRSTTRRDTMDENAVFHLLNSRVTSLAS